ncbi:hypothetical protein TVAG_421040 [Trichomonas vaginalis G3]|uniref:Uncharacterized protein n=1 Tax=Trichomonas vaginalis (strain ATCC PRA-98 / G3) TaxID=412133 RepID=A2EVS9_TRIV3|nr:hypothetical protein TVAGG3_0204160 [Trichomonas vaginalis G3]EAY03216.1 hypothetical protein TVAG_421040 [Trichomonas vaginalis G3]KAI5550814.1 hypothetical protein TVAGG3_0204160 [Trichomonas vaginalis G3]|eukprot:XP_001315439.1 hypothetical protein [Trichomonas vaginalis G3]
MTSTISRTYSDILVACTSGKCSIPFESAPFEFERSDKTKTIIQVVEGEGKYLKEMPKQEEEEEKKEFDQIVEYDMKGKKPDDVLDDIYGEVKQISQHIIQLMKSLYGTSVMQFKASFGIYNEPKKIFILEGATAENLKSAFVANLFGNIPNGESEFQYFMQCAIKPDFFKPPCKNPVHKVKKIQVIYYRAHIKFPSVNEYRLYKIIKERLQDMAPKILSETVNVCIECSINYAGAYREVKGTKLSNGQPKEVDPHVFEALTPLEMSHRRTLPTGFTQNMHKAYCFTVNLRESPYSEQPLTIYKSKPGKPKYEKIAPLKTSKDKWVERLTKYQTGGGKIREIKEEQPNYAHDEIQIPDPKPLPPTYSMRLAKKAYAPIPFKYDYVDKKKNGKQRKIDQKKKPQKTDQKKKQEQNEEQAKMEEDVKEEEKPEEREVENQPENTKTENGAQAERDENEEDKENQKEEEEEKKDEPKQEENQDSNQNQENNGEKKDENENTEAKQEEEHNEKDDEDENLENSEGDPK